MTVAQEDAQQLSPEFGTPHSVGVPMRKWAILAIVASASAAGLGWWWATPGISLECPGHQPPLRANASAVLVAGHGVVSGGFSLEGDTITVATQNRPSTTRPLMAGELEALDRHLRAPRPLFTHLGRAESMVNIEVECAGGTRRLEGVAIVGQQHPTLDTVLRSPGLSMALSWLEGTVHDLDPRPRRLTQLTVEIVGVAVPELLPDP